MVNTTEIFPSPLLQTFIRCYILREFDTLGQDLVKPLPAIHELSFAFCLAGSFSTAKTNFKSIQPGGRKHIIGLQSASGGSVIFNGNIKHFTIQFRPNGFYRLFGIPSDLVSNQAFEASDIISKGMNAFHDTLNEAKDLITMKKCTDEFFLPFALKSKMADPNNSITSTSSLIFKSQGNVNIKRLSGEANMSLRSFEKKFTEQVGFSPKLYGRLTRFNAALKLKMIDTSKTWTNISHHCGYYDQMHFIKEFKEFAGNAPANFFKTTPLPLEKYIQQ